MYVKSYPEDDNVKRPSQRQRASSLPAKGDSGWRDTESMN